MLDKLELVKVLVINVGSTSIKYQLYEMDTEDPEHAFKSMTPLVCERIGKPGTDAFRHWAGHPQLRIMYVNSFLRMGASGS